MFRIRDPKNFACAALFVALSGLLAASALSLPIGTASEMGPGYFPLVLATILCVLGLMLGATSLRSEGRWIEHFEWRGFVVVTVSIVAFAATITRFGFLPASVIAVGLSTLASPRFRPRNASWLVVLLVFVCWLVFVRVLGLPVRLVNW